MNDRPKQAGKGTSSETETTGERKTKDGPERRGRGEGRAGKEKMP